MMGTMHTDSRGNPVFHTNIMTNEQVEVKSYDTRNLNVKKYKQLCLEYDFYYFKQIVKYHQKLRFMTQELRSFQATTWPVLVIIQLTVICMNMFALCVPGLLSSVAYYKTLGMTIFFISGFSLIFLMGEILESYNLIWRSGLINSYWYTCSRRTKKFVPFLFLLSETDNYISFKGLIPCNFKFMVSLIKMGYSVSNLMRLQRVKNSVNT
ncbi:hypothetical protein WDU94_007052 [Cyamophila willieti]